MGKQLRDQNELDKIQELTKPKTPTDNSLLKTKTGNLNTQYEDTKYDEGYLTTAGDINTYKARNQPKLDQFGNSLAKILPGSALAVVESVGDLGELFDNQKNKDYDNIFTEFAREGKKQLNEVNTTYQEGDPTKFPSPHDSGWWFNWGDGIAQSLGGFYAVGAGLGSSLSLGAKAITGALKTGEIATRIGQGVAQLTTATALSYTEGVQIGTDVYKNIKQDALKRGLSEDKARKEASEGASKAVRLNTILATPLNITGLGSVFKSYGKLSAVVRAQLPRVVGESLPKYIARLTELEKTIPAAVGIKDIALSTLREGSQEAFEEGGINLFAESEGYRGKVKDNKLVRSDLDNGIERFADILFSEEGAVNALGGFAGGVLQHVGMEHLPTHTYTNPETGQSKLLSSTKKEQLEQQEYKAQLISTLKEDLGTIQKNQQDLNDAVTSNDKTAINLARNNMFNITTLRSIRNETVKELASEISQYGSVDNTIIGKDGVTDAQRQGLSDNIDDNKYKETAARKSADILKLNREYRDLLTRIPDQFTAQEVFRKRLDLYSYESILEDLNRSALENEGALSVTLPLEELQIAKYKAEQIAFDNAMLYQEERKDDEAVKLLKSERLQVDALYKDAVQNTPEIVNKINNKLNLLQPLISDYSNKLVIQNSVNKLKDNYSEILNNPEKYKKEEIDPRVQEYQKRKDKEEKDQIAKEAKIKQEADYKEAQIKKEEEKRIIQDNEYSKIEAKQQTLNQQLAEKRQEIENKKRKKAKELELNEAFAKTKNLDEISPTTLVTYHGKKGYIVQDEVEGVYQFNEEGTNRFVDLNKESVPAYEVNVFPIEIEQQIIFENIDVEITLGGKLVFIINGKEYINHYSDPLQAIERSSNGEIISVRLHTRDRKPRSFKKFAEEIAYNILLSTYNNESNTNGKGTESTESATNERNDTSTEESVLTKEDREQSRKDEEELAALVKQIKEFQEYQQELIKDIQKEKAAYKESIDKNQLSDEESQKQKDTTLGIDQLSNLTPISETYTPPTIKEREEQDKLIDEELNQTNNLNTPTYGDHNKIAYKAQEQDQSGKTIDIFTISSRYKMLHGNTIHEGTDLVLKVNTESKFYEENKNKTESIPIGVYYKDQLVGFLPIYKGQEKSLLLARNYIVKNKQVETKVSRKTAGVLNKGDKALVSENYAFTPKFLIGRNGSFELNLDNVYDKDQLLNNQSSKSGYLYTLNPTPNNKQIALPVDIDRVDRELVDSLMKVLDLYFKKGNKTNESTLNDEEKTLIKNIQEEYSQDISTVQGLNWWFNQVFTSTDLSSEDKGRDNIDKISKDQRTKNNYIEIIPAGLKIISNPGVEVGTGGLPIIYGRNDINNKDKRDFIAKLLSHTYYRADLTKINSNKEFKIPVLNQENNNFNTYSKKNYNEHLASITRTNIVSVNIGNNQQTVFVQPTINLSFDFMNNPTKENLDFESKDQLKFISLGKTEKVSLATLDEYNQDEFEQSEETMTEEQKEEYKRKCKS